LQRTFVIDGSFIGLQCFKQENLKRFFLLFALVCTICRFVHGDSLHLDTIPKKRYKPIIDFIGFFLQASFFYLMSLSLYKTKAFSFFLSLVLSFDAMWLIMLVAMKMEKLSSTIKQWLWSDIIIIVLLLLLNLTMDGIWTTLSILIISIVAAVSDYYLNRNYYFPRFSLSPNERH
jgi:uncharacterized membrane protein